METATTHEPRLGAAEAVLVLEAEMGISPTPQNTGRMRERHAEWSKCNRERFVRGRFALTYEEANVVQLELAALNKRRGNATAQMLCATLITRATRCGWWAGSAANCAQFAEEILFTVLYGEDGADRASKGGEELAALVRVPKMPRLSRRNRRLQQRLLREAAIKVLAATYAAHLHQGAALITLLENRGRMRGPDFNCANRELSALFGLPAMRTTGLADSPNFSNIVKWSCNPKDPLDDRVSLTSLGRSIAAHMLRFMH